MPWKESAPGRYERSLDSVELILKRVADIFAGFNREHWAVNIVTRLRFEELSEEDIVAGLRRAWIQTRYHHPLIAALLEGTKHVYEVPDQQALEKWVSESFFVHKDKTVDEFLSSVGLMDHSSLHYFPAGSEVLMRTHHWQIDGIGAVHLLDRFLELFSAADEPPASFGEEWKYLPPSHVEAAPLPSESSPKVEEAAQKLFMENPANVPSVGLEMTPNVPGGTRRSTLAFDPAVLDALVAACKEASISVTSAVHAAIVVATQEMAAASTKDKNFVSQAFLDHRPYLQAPYPDARTWPMGCWFLSLPFSLPPADFVTQARALQKIYKQPISMDKCPILDYYEIYAGKAADALSQPLPPGTPMPMPTQPQLSSIGVIDGRVQHSYSTRLRVHVEYVEPLLDTMTPPFLMFQWSWRGRFMINVCCNENYYDTAYVDKFLAKVQDILFEGLGVRVDG